MNDKEISFIIPIYNTDINMLKNCIESIVAQKINDYELILINDGSDSVELNNICINYSYNPNVKYIFQSNFGSAVARNKGLEQATGKFIMFIDADDALEPDFYEKFTSFKNHNFDVMIFNYCFWDSYNEEWIIFNENRCIDLSNRKDELYQNVMFGSSFNCFFYGKYMVQMF
ncbi:MAG: glycosyltransferase [Erysipelotrichaceae bacterium]|nr:glycosyltransferase [Erysipelotrichaceae bacterium]